MPFVAVISGRGFLNICEGKSTALPVHLHEDSITFVGETKTKFQLCIIIQTLWVELNKVWRFDEVCCRDDVVLRILVPEIQLWLKVWTHLLLQTILLIFIPEVTSCLKVMTACRFSLLR